MIAKFVVYVASPQASVRSRVPIFKKALPKNK
jgi:hypothetical protein